jgi:hypothetical protein
MQIQSREEIDRFDAQPAKARVASPPDIFRRTIHAPDSVGTDTEAELGRDDDAVARSLAQESSQQFLFIRWSIGGGHTHASKSQHGNLRSILPNFRCSMFPPAVGSFLRCSALEEPYDGKSEGTDFSVSCSIDAKLVVQACSGAPMPVERGRVERAMFCRHRRLSGRSRGRPAPRAVLRA